MGWRLLGPMRLLVDDRAVDLGPGKQRCVLAALLLTPRRSVPVDVLVERVWGDTPPRSENAVAPYMTRLRRVLDPLLGPGALRFAEGGYLIDCDPGHVDLHRARLLIRRARTDGDDRRAADLLREALAQWQPDAFGGVPGDWAARVREALARERLDAVAHRAHADLRLGRLSQVAEELAPVVDDHPTAEALAAALMTALAGTGRPAEALRRYAQVRDAIGDQLGSEPSPELRALHLKVLRLGSSPAAPVAGAQPGPPAVVPAQLPADVTGFTGRQAEIAGLDALLSRGRNTGSGTLVIGALSGLPGVGKSALAVHWAHRARASFPDGQLYLNLRGFDPAGAVMSLEDAVRSLLSALVSSRDLPVGVDARVGLLRSLLADRRMLLILDNARDSDQVRPLLPGSATSAVLVTSRDQLWGLVAGHGAQPIPIRPLEAAAARSLLTRRIGARRVAAEPDSTDALVTATAGLPLALVTLAARAALHPERSLSAVAAELGTAGRRLDGLGSPDATTDVRTVFSSSYSALTEGAGRLFRLLGVHPGPDFGEPAAASLAGLPAPRVRAQLAELTAAHLVTEHLPGRYHLHDLLRAYAAELVDDGERDAACDRVLDHYAHTGVAAAMLVDPAREPVSADPPRPGVTPGRFTDETTALAWFTTEHAVLMAAARLAAATGRDTPGWLLPWTLRDFLDRQGHWDDWIAAGLIAVDAAHRAGHLAAEATARRVLARAYVQSGRSDEAEPQYAWALRLFADLRDAAGEAHVRFSIAFMHETAGRYDECVRQMRQALALYRAAGHRVGEARALNALGWDLGHLGRYDLTLRHCREALALQRELGDRYGQAAAWDSIGWAHHHLGRPDLAVDSYRQALVLYRQANDLLNEADILEHLGDAQAAAGDHDPADDAWRQAHDILERLAHPHAERLAAKLVRAAPAS